MSSIFPSRTSTEVEPSKASQVPFLKSTKSNKSAPSIIKKIARAGSARNSIDLQRASSEQNLPHYSADSGFSDGLEDGVSNKRRSLKLNRSGSSISAFSSQVGGSGSTCSQPSEIEIPTYSKTRLDGLCRGSSYHARSTSGTSDISAWSRGSGNITPVGGQFRHPWAQTPTIKRENSWSANGVGIGGRGMVGLDRGHTSSYSQPSIPGFGLGGGYSDEDLRDREVDREYEIRGRRSLQLGGGYGLNLDGVDEDEYPRHERPQFARSNTSLSQRGVGGGLSNGGRAYTQGDLSRSYTPISALPPPLTGSSRVAGRGLNLRVNTGASEVGVAGVAGRGAPHGAGGYGAIRGSLYGENSGQVTPTNGSSSGSHRAESSGSLLSAGDANSAVIAPSNFDTSTASSSHKPPATNLNHNYMDNTNQNSVSRNNTIYNTATNSNLNLNTSKDNLSGNISTSHVQSSSGVKTCLASPNQDSSTSPTTTTTFSGTAAPQPSSTLPRKSTSAPRSRPSLDMRTRGLSEPIKQLVEHTKSISGGIGGAKSIKKEHPADVHEARHIFNENQRVKDEKLEKEAALKAEKLERREQQKEERGQRRRERGRASTTSIGSFQVSGALGGLVGGRGRSGTGATANTQETYSTAMGSTTTGSRRHTRGDSGATQAGAVAAGIGGQNGYGYDANYDIDDPSHTEAPAFLDTGEEYAPTEADLVVVNPGAGERPRSSTRGTKVSRQKSPKSEKFKEKLHGAKSDTKSQWASFMLFLKTKLLKMQRKCKKMAAKATGGKKKTG